MNEEASVQRIYEWMNEQSTEWRNVIINIWPTHNMQEMKRLHAIPWVCWNFRISFIHLLFFSFFFLLLTLMAWYSFHFHSIKRFKHEDDSGDKDDGKISFNFCYNSYKLFSSFWLFASVCHNVRSHPNLIYNNVTNISSSNFKKFVINPDNIYAFVSTLG